MSRENLLGELVSRYQERQRQGQAVSPEDVCAEHPELLGNLKSRLQALASMEAFLGQGGGRRSTGEAPPDGLDARSPGNTADAPFPVIAGYHLEEKLGEGGMGVVYRAWQLTPRRRVALEMIKGGHAGTEERARLLQEAQAQAGLEHGNIVRVYEVSVHQGQPYFSLEYVEGGSLDKKFGGMPQPAGQAAEWLETLARAMHVAHDKRIVHRDLKPANVLMTADGTLKVADFGLAKLLEVSAEEAHAGGLTPSGAVLGTPSYMAPEQAQGNTKMVGPPADVYALGAILYECLTGRPPFRGETLLDTLQQVLTEDPVPPRRLNPKAPRDLETIALKCLEKEPQRRYPSALALAEDVQRYREGRPIQARPVGRLGQGWRWCKRNPREAVIAALVLVLVLVGISGALWLDRLRVDQKLREAQFDEEKAQRERKEVELALEQTKREHEEQKGRLRVGADLKQAYVLLRRCNWREAEEILRQAEKLLSAVSPEKLRQQVQGAQDDLQTAEKLDLIRLQKSVIVEGGMNYAAAGPKYLKAFQGYGLDFHGGDVEVLAQRIAESAIKEELLAALDDWTAVDREGTDGERVLAVARRADPDEWRNQFRDPKVRQDLAALKKLADQADVAHLTPSLVWSMGYLTQGREDILPLLRRAHHHSPADFWLNFALGFEMGKKGPEHWDEAIGYYRAALAVRPDSSAVWINLGNVLANKGDVDGAIQAQRKVLGLDPNSVFAYYNLGRALRIKKDVPGAIRSFQKALELNPDSVPAYIHLGGALQAKGDVTEAIQAYTKAVDKAINLDPGAAPMAYSALGAALQAKGDVEGAIKVYQKAIAINPLYAQAHYNLGTALHRRDLEGAIRAYRQAIALAPKHDSAYYNLGNALYAQGNADEAIEAYHQAIAINPKLSKGYANLGAALVAKKDLEGAIKAYHKAIALDPDYAIAYTGLGRALDLGPKQAFPPPSLGQELEKNLKYLGFSRVMGWLFGRPFPRQGGISSEGQDKEAAAQLQAAHPAPVEEKTMGRTTETDVQG